MQHPVRGAVEWWDQQDFVAREIRVPRLHEVGFNIQIVERVVHLLEHGHVIHVIADRHIAQRIGGIGAEQDRDFVVFLEINQLGAQFFQFGGDARDFCVCAVRLQIVREDSFPIGFLSVVQ